MGQIRDLKCLITGGGGFLGTAIARLLSVDGNQVYSLSRRIHPHLAEWDVRQVIGDIADAQTAYQSCQGMDVVFHTAAKAGIWGNRQAYYRTNVTGTRNILDACARSGLPTLIHTSSPSVVFTGEDIAGGNESLPYARNYLAHYPETKALAERLVLDAAAKGLRTIILRPHLIWGPGDNHLVPRILARSRSLKVVGDGQNRVDTIYIDNAAQAHILAAEALRRHPQLSGRIYFISQDAPVALWDMVNQILQAGGKPPVKGRISAQAAYRVGGVLEWIYRFFRLSGEPRMTRFLAKELSRSHWFDISAAKRDLGYIPRISTEEGLRRLGAWLMKKEMIGANA